MLLVTKKLILIIIILIPNCERIMECIKLFAAQNGKQSVMSVNVSNIVVLKSHKSNIIHTVYKTDILLASDMGQDLEIQ